MKDYQNLLNEKFTDAFLDVAKKIQEYINSDGLKAQMEYYSLCYSRDKFYKLMGRIISHLSDEDIKIILGEEL